jgi:hypothetical protein
MTFIETELFRDKRTNLNFDETLTVDFIWHIVVMIFIERALFHVKRTNLNFYEKLLADFIGTELEWNLLKGSSFTLRERT